MSVRFRHLAAVTTGLTFVLILLGVYTAAKGAGLSCSAQWPYCDGGLLPQTLPSLVEWTHRLVAMITGFVILGTGIQAHRQGLSRRIRYASLLALAILPVQVLLGRETVFTYTALVQTAHHAAALVIFAALLAATLWAYDAADSPNASETGSATGYPGDD
jgi:cytochrome c oxidase assembly protein subunit 15